MPLICFSLVWFPSFKTDINLLSKEAFLGAEQMPAESWNLTLSRQPAGSTHPLLWVWARFADLHPVRIWPVTCPSACCLLHADIQALQWGHPLLPSLPRVLLQMPPTTPEQGVPAPAQHHAQLSEGGCCPMGEQWSWGKTGEKRAQKRISALTKNNPAVQGPPERWDPFRGTPCLKGETSLLNRLLSRGDKSFSRLGAFFVYFKQRASTIKEL